MSKATENLLDAQKFAMKVRPQVGGFPFLAETLRSAGVTKNIWHLPACQSIYVTKEGPVVSQGTPLLMGTVDIPVFDQDSLVQALRVDQAGGSSFPEFLQAAWNAGVVHYEVDFEKRRVSYYGVLGECYVEDYPAVEVRR